jgi:hypothetical protein
MRKKLINPLEHLWRHALLLAMLLETSGAWAQPDEATSFDLWVAGVEVTSENAADVTGALPTAAPQVYYNPETNVLTLDKADLKLESGSHRSSRDWYCRLYCIMMCQHLDAWDLPYESQLQMLLRIAA